MGRSLIGGLIADGYPTVRLRASDPDPAQLEHLRRRYPVKSSTNNGEVIEGADVVVLAVKPQVMRAVVIDLAPVLRERRPLVVSIAAGIATAALAGWLGASLPIVRAMPNTPALLGSGATALCANASTSHAHRETAEAVLRSVGLTVWLEDEALMDVVTALSGSGPAYFFLLMELMESCGVALGLPRERARVLTVQTAFGAAKMALEASTDAAALRAQVTSPGGTTEQALRVLQEGGLADLMKLAIAAAAERSRELSRQFGAVP